MCYMGRVQNAVKPHIWAEIKMCNLGLPMTQDPKFNEYNSVNIMVMRNMLLGLIRKTSENIDNHLGDCPCTLNTASINL